MVLWEDAGDESTDYLVHATTPSRNFYFGLCLAVLSSGFIGQCPVVDALVLIM